MRIESGIMVEDVKSNIPFEVLTVKDTLERLEQDLTNGKTVAIWDPANIFKVNLIVNNEIIKEESPSRTLNTLFPPEMEYVGYFIMEPGKKYIWIGVDISDDNYYSCTVLAEVREEDILTTNTINKENSCT